MFSEQEFMDTVCYSPFPEGKRQKLVAASTCQPAAPAYHQQQDPAVKYTAAASRALLNASDHSSQPRCSVNKKNRYRSWVHHRMQARFCSHLLRRLPSIPVTCACPAHRSTTAAALLPIQLLLR